MSASSRVGRQLGDAGGLVLAVAVERDHAVIPARERGFERGAQARAIPQIARMADRAHAREARARSSGVRSVEPSSTTSTSEAYFFTSVSTLTRLAASL